MLPRLLDNQKLTTLRKLTKRPNDTLAPDFLQRSHRLTMIHIETCISATHSAFPVFTKRRAAQSGRAAIVHGARIHDRPTVVLRDTEIDVASRTAKGVEGCEDGAGMGTQDAEVVVVLFLA